MSFQHIHVDDALLAYIRSVTAPEPEYLARLREETARDPLARMQITVEQGLFMGMLVRLMGARRALERPLISPSKEYPGQAIDPFAFIDDDGQAYLYYGQGNLYAYKLKPDMVTLDGAPVKMTPRRFNEGIFVIKRNGLYYFMWSQNDARDVRYEVAYGTAKSPLGPIEIPPDNVILQQRGRAVGTGHHAVVQTPGTDRWYIIYHRHAIPDGNGYTRQTCLARMEFTADGRIQKVDPLAPGVSPDPIRR